LKSIKFAKGNHDSSVLRRERDRGFVGVVVCLSAEIAAGGSTQSSSSSIGEWVSATGATVATEPIGNTAGNINDEALVRPDRGAGGCGGNVVNASSSSSTSASSPASVSHSSSSSSLMLMKLCWRGFRAMRPETREIPSRHARALLRSALRRREVRTEVVFDEKEMKECCKVRGDVGRETDEIGEIDGDRGDAKDGANENGGAE